ncbi:uncharacterized protein G2W53_026786 [Senna tora]|uniref:Uncharacterized protein n=1 Tax=Senna tora TaxID=362788 RepID=A0A834WJ30_9FABA|nr:uncharacterized protein G2W53_026786 [Senna tora]
MARSRLILLLSFSCNCTIRGYCLCSSSNLKATIYLWEAKLRISESETPFLSHLLFLENLLEVLSIVFVQRTFSFLLPFQISDIVCAKMTGPDFNVGNLTNGCRYRQHGVDREASNQCKESREEASQAQEVTRTMLKLTGANLEAVGNEVIFSRGHSGGGEEDSSKMARKHDNDLTKQCQYPRPVVKNFPNILGEAYSLLDMDGQQNCNKMIRPRKFGRRGAKSTARYSLTYILTKNTQKKILELTFESAKHMRVLTNVLLKVIS